MGSYVRSSARTESREPAVRRLGAWYGRHVWAATGALVALVLVAGAIALQIVTYDRVADGVTVAGVPLGGLTRVEAAATIAAKVGPRVDVVQLATGHRQPLTLRLEQLGMTIDSEATAAAAYGVGRHHLPFGGALWLPLGGADVKLATRVDTATYQQGLEAVRAVADVVPRDARLDLAGDSVAVVPAKDGLEVDAVALARAIVASAAAGRAYVGPVPMKTVAPRVSTLAAESRAAAAETYLSRPLALRYRATEIKLSPDEIASLLTVNTAADADTYPLTFRNQRARARLRRVFAFAESPPVDARIVVGKDGSVSVTESRSGNVIDMDVLLEDLDDAASGGGLRSVFVALTPAFPKLSTADVEAMGLSSLGSQFVTYFDPRKATRAGNIALAAKLVDGTVVRPGETFSLNDAIGPRTTNRGFDYAPVIAADNVLRQGVGGGICQYATTLFNAVFFAGLPVVERRPHSLYISHYPVGRDATVAWGSVDLRFRNDTAKSLMIRSWVDGAALTVALVGKTGRAVTYATSDFYDVRKPAHGKANPRVIYDDDLGPGVIRWEKGIDGRSVKVVRTVRERDGSILSRDTFVSRYLPMDWVKRIGR